MIKPEQVPRDAILAARDEIRKVFQNEIENTDVLRLMIAAAINAWPDKQQRYFPAFSMEKGHFEVPMLMLPMWPKEGEQ